MLAVDFVLPAHSGKMAITSFCVEQGRWRVRGVEPVAAFNASAERISSKNLKMAVSKNQCSFQTILDYQLKCIIFNIVNCLVK